MKQKLSNQGSFKGEIWSMSKYPNNEISKLDRLNDRKTLEFANDSKSIFDLKHLYLKATIAITFKLSKHLMQLRMYLREWMCNRFPNSNLTIGQKLMNERGDVPGWVLVVLMTTGLVTAIWTIAQPRLSTILRNSLDSMNNVR